MKKTILLNILGVFLSLNIQANVSMPKFFSSNMVLQRDMPIAVFGNATIGETVTITFNGASATAITSNSGKWEVKLPAMSFGGPYTMSVQGTSNTISLSNVLIGDVYICSGQSNMEFQLNQEASANTEIPASTNNNIRLITVPKNFNTVPQTDIPQASWLVCNTTSSYAFSAVAYYFGKNLQANLNIPIGLITAAWWATSIREWMAWDEIIQIDPSYKQYAGKTIEQASGKTQADYLLDVSGFVPAWPSLTYNGMINPFIKFGIKGVIWYQGEANTGEAARYKILFQDMIADWRKKWGYDFGFFWVQLPGYGTETTVPQQSQWAELRAAQNAALSVAKTGQAVITDLGDAVNLHPTNKKDVGFRLAQTALKINYGQNILGSGPELTTLTLSANTLVLEFSNIGTGLSAKNNNGVLNGFSIAGNDMIYCNANATIVGNKVTVSSSSVSNPIVVRYAWSDNPIKANLINSDGLLASPFQKYIPQATNQIQIVGFNKCYSVGTINSNASDKGGIVGMLPPTYTVSECFFLDTNIIGGNAIGTSKSSADMKDAALVTTLNGTSGSLLWKAGASFNNGYPVLAWESLISDVNEELADEASIHLYQTQNELIISGAEGSTVKFLNILGGVIYSTNVIGESQRLSVSQLKSGCYIVLLEKDGNTLTKKVVIY